MEICSFIQIRNDSLPVKLYQFGEEEFHYGIAFGLSDEEKDRVIFNKIKSF